MNFPEDQIEELKLLFCPDLALATEGGTDFIRMADLKLPPGCEPGVVDALLCPASYQGYDSRLFYSSLLKTPTQRNWNANSVQILGRNWFAFSWKTKPGLRLAQMVAAHMMGLRP